MTSGWAGSFWTDAGRAQDSVKTDTGRTTGVVALFRLVLLAGGIGLGQMGLDSFAHGTAVALVQFGLALILLAAGSAGFIVPLLTGALARRSPSLSSRL